VTRAPGWLTEATAWAAALVLVAGVAVAASGVVQHREEHLRRTVVADDEPVLVRQVGQKADHAPRQVPTVRVGGRATSAGSTIASLGPPPGPHKDLVPDRYAAPQDRWALLVGITRYRKPTHNTLAGANDVAFVRSYLLAAGWLPDHIKVLTNEAATGRAMRSGLAWLAAKSQPGTFTLFHYSGHVKQAGGHEKLWPYDRAFINDTELAAVLKPTHGKMWVDIAGCEAAGFIEDLPSDRVLVSTSSKSTQKSYENPAWGESVMVGLLYDAGMNQRQADANGNGTVTVGEALRFAAYWAQVVTYYQRPHGRQSPQVRGMPVRGWTLADPPA
jgi:hypothetical protein